jgi:hypothetical protein
MTMRKQLFFPFVFLLAACSQQHSKMNYIDWSKDSGEKMNAASEKLAGDPISVVTSKYGKVEFQNQKISGLEVDQSFVKKVADSQGELIRLQAQYESSEVSKLKLLAWSRAQRNKDSTLATLIKLHPELKNKKIESFKLKLVSEGGGLKPRWFLSYSEPNGELWEATFAYSLQSLSVAKMGSGYDVISAWVYPKGPKKSDLQEVYLFNLLKADELMSSLLKVTSADNTKIQVSGQPLQFTISDARFDQVQTFYLSQKTLEWFSKTFDIHFDNVLDVEVNVGAPDKTNTAFYYGGKVRLGTGDDVVYSKIPWDPSIVTHESSHFVIDLLAHLPFQGEGGSLNEAYADYFAATLLDNPRLAEASYLQGSYKRRIDEAKKYSSKNGGLYNDSLIVSSLLWDINQKFTTQKGLALAFQTLQNLNPQSTFDSFNSELRKQATKVLSAPENQKFVALLKEREWKVE